MNTQKSQQHGASSQGVSKQQGQSQYQPQQQQQQAPADPLVAGVREDIRQVAQLGYN